MGWGAEQESEHLVFAPFTACSCFFFLRFNDRNIATIAHRNFTILQRSHIAMIAHRNLLYRTCRNDCISERSHIVMTAHRNDRFE